MASISASVEAPPTAGVQVTEGLLAGAVPAGVFSIPGALSSGTAVLAGGVTNTTGATLFEWLLTMLGIGGGPYRPPAFQFPNPSNKVGSMEVIVFATWSSTICGISATFFLSS